jgi:uncharacterized protein YukE
MGSEFSVNPEELSAGARVVGHLSDQAGAIGAQLQQTLQGMAQAVGDAGLAALLVQTSASSAGRLAQLEALYQHIDDGLRGTARSYRSVDEQVAQRIRSLHGGLS